MENIKDETIESILYRQLSTAGRELHRRRGEKPTQERILFIIHRHGGAVTQREMQEMLKIRQGSLSEVVSKLEDKGLIVKTQDPADKRRMVLQLTPEGEALREENHRLTKEDDSHLFDILSNEEKAQLSGIMEKLLSDWQGGNP